ncbi:MAG: DNA ligase [Rhodocyclaceae bacterium]|nr:DNA ligase [Rhodocyclaceae bacterium]
MRRRLLFVALAGCFVGIGDGEFSLSMPAWAEAARSVPPAILLAEVFRPDIDPAQYWVSEKYDGVRAIWDGRELRFRSGRRVPAPAWFVAGLPREPLDGELWLGRGRFDELSGIVRKAQPSDAEWRRVRYMIFELPDGAGSFTERIERLRTIIAGSGMPWLHLVEQFRIADRQALAKKMDDVVRAGGEGLMLHRAAAPYVTGRSDDLLKLKPWRDAEATVIGHEPGEGRLAGVVGALRLKTAEGKEFRLGSGLSDALRRNPPAIGASVTYRYQELTKDGVPRFPRYWRMHEEF